MIENQPPGPGFPSQPPEPPEPPGQPEHTQPPPPPTRRRPNWALWLLIFGLGLTFLFVASIYSVLSGVQQTAPTLRRGSTVSIDLAHSYPEDPMYAQGAFVASSSVTFRDLLFGIKSAKDDARVDHLFLHVRGTSLGWANTFELHEQLLDFKENGKPIVAFVEYASTRDYVIASAADEVYLHPRSLLDLRGIRAELLFMKGALEKIGVEAEFERFGAYKDAPDSFLRDDMSPASREAISALIETIHTQIVDAIATGRERSAEEVESWIAGGPWLATDAKEAGLVDELEYIDQVRARMSSREDREPNLVSIAGYRGASGSLSQMSGFTTKGRIALIYGVGAIVGGGSGEDAVFGRVMGSDTIAKAFKAVREDDSIDAVIFRIDSPGGSDVASDVIWREAKLTAEEKPLIVSMANVAASGGYWIAMASDTVVAEPTTITGSIGIYAGKFNLAGLYEKLGFSRDGVSTAPNADFFSDSRNFTPEERARFRALIKSGYDAFLERVAEARGMTTEAVHEVAQGRVWSGQMALEAGLVDELGGLNRALTIAKEKLGYEADDKFEVRIYPQKKTMFEALLEDFLQSRSRAAKPPGLELVTPRELLAASPLLERLVRGETLALLPYELEIH